MGAGLQPLLIMKEKKNLIELFEKNLIVFHEDDLRRLLGFSEKELLLS